VPESNDPSANDYRTRCVEIVYCDAHLPAENIMHPERHVNQSVLSSAGERCLRDDVISSEPD
jgi:hypothetical protein